MLPTGCCIPKLLDTELETYEQNLDDLLGKAERKFVLIRKDKVVGVFDSKMDAIAEGYQKFGDVPFLVKQVLKIETPKDFASNHLGF